MQQINVALTPIVFNGGQININSEVVEENRLALNQRFEIVAAVCEVHGCGLGRHRDIDG